MIFAYDFRRMPENEAQNSNCAGTASDRLTVARLTATGRSAVATLSLEGVGAARLVDSLFTARNSSEGITPGDRLFVGRFQDPRHSGQCAEEIVVRCSSERSAELHCHGGSASIARIESILVDHGCEVVDWRRRVDDSHDDPIRAAAFHALTKAETSQTAAVLLDQYQGALRRAVDSILASLAERDLAVALEKIEAVLEWANFGRHLVEPWRVVLAGRPNVGKSTLINALVGYSRAIVHHVPGTTRDVLTATTAMEGWPVVLADTAGLRPTEHVIERAGVQLAEKQFEAADLVLLVSDASGPWSDEDSHLYRRRATSLIVHNKIDLVEESRVSEIRDERPPGILASGLTGEGITELATAIGRCLVPCSPPPLTAVPFTDPQAAALRTARAACEVEGGLDAARSALLRL